jgi:hypothetical protein
MFKKIGYAAALIALVPLAACQKAEKDTNLSVTETGVTVEGPSDAPAEEPTSEAAK